MGTRIVTGNYAAAYGALRSRVKIVSAYPITPQTFIVEHCAEFISNGELDAEYVPVESEHSAMSVCISAVATGVRCFTATSSQGLALMHELLSIASGLRTPMVMPVVNRTLAAPIGIWGEYNDVMPERDSGWLQVFCENNQEVFDMIVQGYRLAEHKDVLLPIIVNLDAFILSHTVEPVAFPEQAEVDKFLPAYEPMHAYLRPEDPIAIGPFTPPEYQMEIRYQVDEAMRNARRIIPEITKEFASMFGRDYSGMIEEYLVDDAEVVLLTSGTLTGTAREIVDEYRAKGKKVGLVKLRFFRPFPADELRALVNRGHIKAFGVFDKSVSFGSGGPIYIDTRSALYGFSVPILNFLAGIGGRDITFDNVRFMFDRLHEAADGKIRREIFWINTRGVEP